MPFPKHKCLFEQSYSMLPPIAGPGLRHRVHRQFLKWLLVSEEHPLAYDYYRSFPTVVAARQLHVLTGSEFVIHPYSVISLFWSSLMVFVNIAHMSLSVFRLCYTLDPPGVHDIHVEDCIMLVLHLMCLLDVAERFRLGYVAAYPSREIVMSTRRIACHYLATFFTVDLISSLPITFVLLLFNVKNNRVLVISDLIPLLRNFRIVTVLRYLNTFVKIFTRSYIWRWCTRYTAIFVLSAHFFSCAIYITPVLLYRWNGKIPMNVNYLIKSGIVTQPLYNTTFSERYDDGLLISMSAFFGAGITLYRISESEEIIASTLIYMGVTALMIYTMVFMMRTYSTLYYSQMKYHEMMDQVKKYMHHKQYPNKLRQRVIQFYKYKYHEELYYKEEALASLPVHLRYEVQLYTCRKLVEKVGLFKDLPAHVVGSILACLRPEVFLEKDLVIRAGDIGDCMYFIESGTVAVLSLRGAEVCQLQDGAHFGEVALLVKDNKRMSTVLAVEISLLYRLDAADFRRFVKKNRVLWSRIEALATQRTNETTLQDELFRQDAEPSDVAFC